MRPGRCLVGWDAAHVPGGARVIACRECGQHWYPVTTMRTMTPVEYRRAYQARREDDAHPDRP